MLHIASDNAEVTSEDGDMKFVLKGGIVTEKEDGVIPVVYSNEASDEINWEELASYFYLPLDIS